MKYRFRLFLLTALLTFAAAPPEAPAQGSDDAGWIPLFNGEDLTGWETWLGKVPGEQEALGLNNDPLGVFTVEDGMLHISGQVFGALTTLEEYGNYHLRLEQKWGEKRWPPKEGRPRDSGICYHATGPHGAFLDAWMSSLQYQIQEGDTGEYWSIAGPAVTVEAVQDGPFWRYTPGAPSVAVQRGRVLRKEPAQEAGADWNVLELIVEGATAAHVVNGDTVMVLQNVRHDVDGQIQLLTRGKIQLQSEGAEVWYRNIELKPLD